MVAITVAKMGCAIQFESHRGELAAIYQFEHDPVVLEFYDQPPALKLTYPSKKGRQVGVLHTPDFFVIREDGGGWIECKMEEHLVDVPIEVFDALITPRKVTIATASRDDEARSAEEHERLTKASSKHLEIATQRWQAQFRTAKAPSNCLRSTSLNTTRQ